MRKDLEENDRAITEALSWRVTGRISDKISGVPAEIGTECLPSTIPELFRCTICPGEMMKMMVVHSVTCMVCVTLLISSLRQECSESLMVYHSYTVQLLSLYNSTVSGVNSDRLTVFLSLTVGLSKSSPDRIRDTDLMSSTIRCFGNAP
jgi:hypothetical protein